MVSQAIFLRKHVRSSSQSESHVGVWSPTLPDSGVGHAKLHVEYCDLAQSRNVCAVEQPTHYASFVVFLVILRNHWFMTSIAARFSAASVQSQLPFRMG